MNTAGGNIKWYTIIHNPETNNASMFPVYYEFRDSVFALLTCRFCKQGFLKQFCTINNCNPNINKGDFVNQTILSENMYANKYGKYFCWLIKTAKREVWCRLQTQFDRPTVKIM